MVELKIAHHTISYLADNLIVVVGGIDVIRKSQETNIGELENRRRNTPQVTQS
jgi:hypothetical protein